MDPPPAGKSNTRLHLLHFRGSLPGRRRVKWTCHSLMEERHAEESSRRRRPRRTVDRRARPPARLGAGLRLSRASLLLPACGAGAPRRRAAPRHRRPPAPPAVDCQEGPWSRDQGPSTEKETRKKRRELLLALAAAPFAARAAGPTKMKTVEELQKNWKSFLPTGASVPSPAEPLKLSDQEWAKRLPGLSYR